MTFHAEETMRDFLITPELEFEFSLRMDRNQLPYHNFSHVRQMLSDLPAMLFNNDRMISLGREYATLVLAIMGHDVVYVPGRYDNEQQSAEVTKEILHRYCDAELADSVVDAILSTRPGGVDRLSPHMHQYLHDLDYLVFGQPRSVYDSYRTKIQQEYGVWPVGQNTTFDKVRNFVEGRRRFLESIDPDNLFLLKCNNKLYSHYVRWNIEYELNIALPATLALKARDS